MLVRVALAVAALLLVALAGGAWLLVQPSAGPFVVAGAAEVRVEETGLGGRRISYHMTRPEDGWQTLVARGLRRGGWDLVGDRYAWGDTEDYVPTYTRSARLWFIRLDEQARLLGTRSYALILVERRLQFQW
ncbi:MAG TPA: hypothetical protein VNL77_17025 [Roseiflexaceae bacterium]|nr:hypothetical protein [Roseiflexaceae bacterium]